MKTLIERVLRRFLHKQAPTKLQAQDLELINEDSEYLNSEAADVLKYQTDEE